MKLRIFKQKIKETNITKTANKNERRNDFNLAQFFR